MNFISYTTEGLFNRRNDLMRELQKEKPENRTIFSRLLVQLLEVDGEIFKRLRGDTK